MGMRGRTAAAVLLAGLLTACSAQSTSRPDDESSAADGTAARPFTLVATGDVIPYPSIIAQAHRDAGGKGYDFRAILADVEPVVSAADLALCHLEVPLGDEDGPFTGYPLFSAPPQLAASLRATGYDGCSTASNHTLDGGWRGLRRTLDAMDAAGLRHAGSARSAKERDTPALLHAGTATVAHLSYTYGTNGIPLPPGKPWAVNLLDPHRVIADARAARRAGADVVVVSVHWGTEWQQAPDEQQLEVARALTAARSHGRRDIDLVIGTHNHLPQAYEKVHGTWVVYGLGDQVASFVPSLYRGNEGSMARFTFAPPQRDGGAWTVRRAQFLVSHCVTGPPFRVVRATTDTSAEAHERVRDAVLGRGAAQDGLTEAR
jgi:poly-gamma-glutamate synthesis protein (capsule biosynthesis protein)